MPLQKNNSEKPAAQVISLFSRCWGSSSSPVNMRLLGAHIIPSSGFCTIPCHVMSSGQHGVLPADVRGVHPGAALEFAALALGTRVADGEAGRCQGLGGGGGAAAALAKQHELAQPAALAKHAHERMAEGRHASAAAAAGSSGGPGAHWAGAHCRAGGGPCGHHCWPDLSGGGGGSCRAGVHLAADALGHRHNAKDGGVDRPSGGVVRGDDTGQASTAGGGVGDRHLAVSAG